MRPMRTRLLSIVVLCLAAARAVGSDASGRRPPQFANTNDPDCRAMLRAPHAGRAMALQTPEADMPGFQAVTNNP